MIFEELGWHLDYYFNKKYIGSKRIERPDREKAGYYGRIEEPLSEDLLMKGRMYRKGTVLISECIPLCGRVIG
jgi:hypothetical protein|tara:strand:- start:287 stop:505 length:219 start_codon:yes stop_codon:yes gene_type:complete